LDKEASVYIFFIQNALKQGDASSPLHFNFVVAHAIRKAVGRQNGMKPMGHIGFYADDVTLLCKNIIFLHHEAACVSHTFQTKN
jgi:hypothetical protein